MGQAVSFKTGNGNDVLAGTVLGVLPDNAPAYQVEVRVAKNSGDSGEVSLQVDGVSVLLGAMIPVAGDSDNPEPDGDTPIITFNAPAGARLTMNISGMGSGAWAYVYVDTIQEAGVGRLTLGHLFEIDEDTADALSGTNVSQVPSDGMYRLLMAARSVQAGAVSASSEDGSFTVIVDSDTLVENFRTPLSIATPTDLFNESRDFLVSALVTGGSRITLNAKAPVRGNDTGKTLYAVYLIPA
ncbi:hypothetical protein F4X10_21305 [Candidatus Poribacteria bacterium]|nr:hypothetical protein [Candidatus Poribacteria bacterium]